MTAGLVTVAACVLLAVALGGWRAYADGRFRGTRELRPDSSAEPAPTPGAAPLVPADQRGERATLLQFSSAFCAPCRATRRVLADVAATVPGVAHVEIDAEQHLELVRRVGVLRTPTPLVLDGAGHEVARAAGAPRAEQVLAAVARVAD